MAELVDTTQPVDTAQQVAAAPRRSLSSAGWAVVIGIVIVAAIGGVSGWLAYRTYQDRAAHAERNEYVQTARQAAVNLTTINYTEADADVQRILDSATGTFRDEFQQRSGPFVDIVKKVQSTSKGTVTEAGLLSRDSDDAQVLVTVSMTTSTAAAPQQDPRGWRLRISLHRDGDTTKVSNVEFVP